MNPTPKLAAALVKAQAAFPKIAKDATADAGQYSYSYATLPAVLEAVLPSLNASGIALSFGGEPSETCHLCTATLLHESGEALTASLPVTVGEDMQKFGSRLSYTKRYLVGMICAVAIADDDDGQAGKDTRQASGNGGARTRGDSKKDKAIAFVEGHLKATFGDGPPWEPREKAQVMKDLFGSGKWRDFLTTPEAQILPALAMDEDGRSRFTRTCDLVLSQIRRPDDVDPADWPQNVADAPGPQPDGAEDYE
jgi:hypothetical protein